MTAASLWWRMRSLDARHDRVPGLLSVIAFAVATGALLVSLGGLRAFETRNAGDVSGPDALWPTIGETYVTLAWVAATCVVIPILTLGGVPPAWPLPAATNGSPPCVQRRHLRPGHGHDVGRGGDPSGRRGGGGCGHLRGVPCRSWRS